jgi:hypothetical protein
MVRAEKKGTTIGPTLGSLDGRNEVSLILSEKELTVLNKITHSAPESIRHGGYYGPESSADVSSGAQSISRVCRGGLQPIPFRKVGGRLH